jgi:hypothetical protein
MNAFTLLPGLLALVGCATTEVTGQLDEGLETLELVIYSVADGTDEAEIDRRLEDGATELELQNEGLLAVHSMESVELVDDVDFAKAQKYHLSDGGAVSFLLGEGERANVYHRPPASTCRYEWDRRGGNGVNPVIEVDYFWSTGSGWNWWDEDPVYGWSTKKKIWAGSDNPKFKYKLTNRAGVYWDQGVRTSYLERVWVEIERKNPGDC